MNISSFQLKKETIVFFFSLFLLTTFAHAQSEAEISGKITDALDSQPLPGVSVVIKNTSTGFIAGVATDINGNYLIRDIQLGGPYSITVSYIGYQSITKTGYTLNLGDKLKINFQLNSGENLDEIVITSKPSTFQNKEGLGSALSITGKTLEKIPTISRNYQDLASLSPLSTPKLGLAGGSSFGGISIAGSNGGTTGFTLDGVNVRRQVFGGVVDGPAFTISLEAIREFEIVTNEYDVSGPRSSGGSVKAVTKGGSNDWTGAAWYYGSGQGLSGDRNFNGSQKRVDFNNNQSGFRLSGPIIKDKLNFVAVYDRFIQEDAAGVGNNSSGFINFNSGETYPFVQSDVQNFVNELATLGILKSNSLQGQIGEQLEKKTTENMFLRFDWNVNDKNHASLSYNYLNYEDSFEAGADGFDNVTLFSRGYPFLSKDHKLIAQLKSRFESGSNNLKLSIGRTERINSLASGTIHSPRISVGSINNGPLFRVGAGLATWVPEQLYSNTFQLIDVLTKNIGNDTYTFGFDLLVNSVNENIPHNTASSFRYNSLQDFQNGTPFFFNKKFTLDPNDDGRLRYTSTELALFTQGEYDLLENLKLTLGLRWDITVFSPNQNPTNSNLGAINFRGNPLVNDSRLRDFNNIQPRLSLIWDKDGKGKEIFKFGAGFFSSQFTTQPYTLSLGLSGTRFVEVSTTNAAALQQIHQAFTSNGGWVNVGNQISLQDFSNFTGQNVNTLAADVIVLDPDFDMPMTFKMSASYHRFFNDWFRLGGSFYYNNTKNVPFYNNINLQQTGTNPLDGRAVYSNGANPSFGNIHVFQNSDWRATFIAGSIEAYAKLPKGGTISLSFTKSASKGFSYYNAGGGIENGKPVSYSYDSYPIEAQGWHDDNSIPNKLVFSFVSPEFKGFTISGSLIAGQFGRFSATTAPNANGNGIGTTNLAYVPTDSEVENTRLIDPNTLVQYNPYEGFNLMLASTSPEYREYINANRGKFADFNGGIQPWSYNTNLSLIKEFSFGETRHKLNVRMDIFNILNLFDYKEGSFDVVGNTNLINENNGVYSVNPIAGRYNVGGDQFRIQFGVKYQF